MSEKKYIGKGKSTQYSKNCQISLNSLFETMFKDTNDKSIVKAFETVKTGLKAANLSYVNIWQPKEGNEKFELKISISNLQNPDKIGNDLTIYLNEFIPVKQAETVQTVVTEEIKDDLPF